MPSRNLKVTSSSTIDSKAVFWGVVCTLATKTPGNEGVDGVYSQPTPDAQNTGKKLPYIADVAELAKVLETETGEVCVVKKANQDQASHILKLAKQSDPRIAEGIKILEALGVSYFIEVIRKSDLIKGSGDGALGVWDPEGIDEGSPLYIPALKNQASLSAIGDVDVKQQATVKKLLTTLGNLVRISPDSPHKKKATHFKYFLDEVYEVLSHLKRTHAPEALLPCVVTAVFAKYKHECWDAVMRLAADDAAKDLQTCADVLLDTQHVNNYLKFMEEAESTPPGPSSKAFNVAFGLLKEVDTETASAFRDLVVCLHDTVKRQVESLDKVRSLQVNEGVKDGEVESQVNQLNICIRNYLQTFYNIAQDFVRIERMSVSNKKAHQQAAMHDRIAGVSRKFWPALESCLKSLCDSTVVEDIKSKAQTLTKQLTAASIRASQLASDAESTTVKDLSSDSYWSRLYSLLGSLLGNQDGVKEEDSTKKSDGDNMSPMFADLLEIMEQLKTYGQVASASPEESPNVPNDIQPGDHVAICGALGFVSKPLAAAIFSYLRKLQSCLDFVDYRAIAKEGELASIEKFLNVDHHMMKAVEDEGHSFGVQGNSDPKGCDQIMVSVFDKHFQECWPYVSAVLKGGDQEAPSDKLKQMATDISNWKDSGQEVDSEISSSFWNIKKLVDINVLWYLAGMSQFIKGAASDAWEWHSMTQELWTDAMCPYMRPGVNKIWRAYSSKSPWVLCLPRKTADNYDSLVFATSGQTQTNSKEGVDHYLSSCQSSGVTSERSTLYYHQNGDPDWSPKPHPAEGPLKDLMLYTGKHGVDVSCRRAFAYHWYDATEDVLRVLCNEALEKFLSKGFLTPTQNSTTTKARRADYRFRLLTAYPGSGFKDKITGSKYLGFVLCTDKIHPTDEEVMHSIVRRKLSKKQVRAHRQCSRRTFEYTSESGKQREYRSVKVFKSTVKVKPNGHILVRNPDHAGLIGSCWDSLRKELTDLRDEKKSRQSREASNVIHSNINSVTENGQFMSQEDIVKAFAAAEREGLIKINEYYGDFDVQGNDTDPFDWTTYPSALQLSDGGQNPITNSEALIAYWPYVLGVAGTIGAIFSAKKVWDNFKTRPGKEYKQVIEGESPV